MNEGHVKVTPGNLLHLNATLGASTQDEGHIVGPERMLSLLSLLAAQFSENDFEKNRGTNGAAVWQNNCKQVLYTHNNFTANVASAGSGGIEINQGSANVTQCAFTLGKGQKGGAVYMQVGCRPPLPRAAHQQPSPGPPSPALRRCPPPADCGGLAVPRP